MRRSAPPGLRLDAGRAAPFARVAAGPRGLGFLAMDPPDGLPPAPGDSVRAAAAVPVAVTELSVVAGGRLVLAMSPGVAQTHRAPGLEQIHNRRLPGLRAAVGSPLSNAALLRDDDGWRAVVLPSLGDLVAGLGGGPVALRADGRRVAVVRDGSHVEEIDLPDGGVAGRHDGAAAALCYAGEALLAASGAGVGPIGSPGPADGSPVVALAGAASAPRAAARHADGSVSIWDDAGARLAAWPAPGDMPMSLGISVDGAAVTLGTPHAEPAVAACLRTEDGAVVRHVLGARALALAPDDEGLAIGGDWGVAWLRYVDEREGT